MPRDTNPEVEALRIDTRDFVGLHVSEIEARFSSGDVRLIRPVGPLPTGWPHQIRERAGPRMIDFRLETVDGEFRRWSGYAWNDGDTETPPTPVFGYLFTRRPLASPRFRSRPIVQFQLDFEDVCIHASAALPELHVKAVLQAMDVEAGRGAPPSLDRVFAQRLGLAFGLEPPGCIVDLGDFEVDAHWRERERFVLVTDPPGFQLDDSTGAFSIFCTAESDGGATAASSRVGERGTAVAIPRAGIRFAACDGALSMLGFVDLYAGDLGLVFRDAMTGRVRRVRVLLVASRTGEPEARSLPPGATILLVLGSPLPEWAPAEDPSARVEPTPGGLRLVARGGVERLRLAGRVEHSPGSAHVFADITDEAGDSAGEA